MLAAENKELDTLWVGPFDPTLLKAILPGTDTYDLAAIINVGYPTEDSRPSPKHGVRKSMVEFVMKIE